MAEAPASEVADRDAGSDSATSSRATPILDIVRIEPDGAGLVAGRATPESDVEIIVGDRTVGRARAGLDGGFVAMITTEPSAGVQRVVAREMEPEPVKGTASDAPRSSDGSGMVTPASPPPGPDVAETGDSAPVFVIGAAKPDAAPLVVEPTGEGVRMLQGPARGPADAVALDTITYDDSGRVVLTGRAPEGAEVRIYFNEKAAGAVETAEDGSWTFRPGEDVSPGTYRLRLDEVDAAGDVSSRIETPFRREAISPGAAPSDEMIVQRGDSLWRIAENVYGAGMRYTLIYDANSDAIADPDLIYPGQIFDLPEAKREE
ncbi:LysM peptidoglycan-binding domain-containing protein [Pikeienuella piscinae]|uniref:LysM peptidoglycan-binding domain-containing protein n=1 Tax=Pikeienuella piscinae TaxID=2748098 RepID=A0A7L5BSN0_9RHOB|nr:Ig-like domain-containing protein [Pikeienuella piscinae]QIE54540.1 LysM peptidoglycan-binding domain-containing protein [Pikeienuella piscinae]